MNITFIGGGNMASALIAGLLQKGFPASGLRVVEVAPEARDRLQAQFGVATCADLDEAPDCDVIVLAVKPQQLFEVASRLRGRLGKQLVISIAAGIRATDLSRWLGGYSSLVRAMPNTPAMVMAGVSGLYALPEVTAEQKRRAGTILEAVGSILWLDDERNMDAITAISGSGPAYVFYFLQALQEAALGLGLSAEQARLLGSETFRGASLLAAQSPEDFAALRARVTSRGGTTERAIARMEAAQVRQHIIAAVEAAASRSRELGDELGQAG